MKKAGRPAIPSEAPDRTSLKEPDNGETFSADLQALSGGHAREA
jgi:hypothetical protein